jgi:hypothetical protein
VICEVCVVTNPCRQKLCARTKGVSFCQNFSSGTGALSICQTQEWGFPREFQEADEIRAFFKENGHPDRQNPIFFLVGSQSSRALRRLARGRACGARSTTCTPLFPRYHVILLSFLGAGPFPLSSAPPTSEASVIATHKLC